jgi:hypothetical protein
LAQVAISLMTLMWVAACGAGSGDGGVTHLDADWTVLYHDLGHLKRASDLAVAGTFASASGQTVQDGIPYSDFVFTVNRPIYDPGRRLQTTSITVHQTGGTLNGRVAEIQDDPLFRVGERSVLFLHEYSPGRYFVVGGPSGRFEVGANGAVRPFNDEGVHMATVPLDAFAADVERA